MKTFCTKKHRIENWKILGNNNIASVLSISSGFLASVGLTFILKKANKTTKHKDRNCLVFRIWLLYLYSDYSLAYFRIRIVQIPTIISLTSLFWFFYINVLPSIFIDEPSIQLLYQYGHLIAPLIARYGGSPNKLFRLPLGLYSLPASTVAFQQTTALARYLFK